MTQSIWTILSVLNQELEVLLVQVVLLPLPGQPALLPAPSPGQPVLLLLPALPKLEEPRLDPTALNLAIRHEHRWQHGKRRI